MQKNIDVVLRDMHTLLQSGYEVTEDCYEVSTDGGRGRVGLMVSSWRC